MDVASIDNNSHRPIFSNTHIAIDDTKCTAGKVGSTTFWKLPTKTMQTSTATSATSTITTNNTFDALESNDDYQPVQYKSTWMLDSAAIGVYGDMNTIVCKRKKIKHGSGIKVGTADKNLMQQVATGIARFDKLPPATMKSEIFLTMQSPLLGCGPLVKKDCTVVLKREQASIVTGATQQSI